MISEEELIKLLKNKLPSYRFKHVLGVRNKAVELAKCHNIDIKRVIIPALFHDIARHMDKGEMLKYLEDKKIKISDDDKVCSWNLHGLVGSVMAKDYGLNSEMRRAIRYHTVGRPGMGVIEKIIFIADSIEDNRVYDDLDDIRKIARIDLDEALKMLLDRSIKYTISKGEVIHLNVIKTRNYLLLEKK